MNRENEPKPDGGLAGREAILASLVCCLSLAYLFHSFLLSRGDSITGDFGDARLCMVILEHWWAVCHGLASPRDPNFLAPAHDVLGYSHTLFAYTPIYLPLRLLHLDTYMAFELTLMALRALGFAFTYLMLRRTFRLPIAPSLAGACLFTVANISVRSSGHAQLLNVMFVPLQVILIGRYFKNRSTRSLAAAGFLTGAMMFTDVYEVFFEVLMALALIPAWTAVEWSSDRASLARRLRDWSRHGAGDILFAAPFFLIWLLPFFAVYYPVFGRTGGRPYAEVFSYLRDWREILNPGPDNWLWGRSLGKWFQGWVSPVGEAGFGITPLVILIAALATLLSLIRIITRRRADREPPDWRPRAIAILGLASGALYIVSVHFGIHSLWWVIYHVIPGAKGLRVPGRVNALLALNTSVLCALTLAWLLSQRPVRLMHWAAAMLTLCLIAEQVNAQPASGISRSSELRYFARLSNPPPGCQRFSVINPRLPETPFVGQIDAMILARRVNIATINGYSGSNAPGWDLYYFDSGYPNRVASYLLANNIWSGTCTVDLERGHWTPASEPRPAFSGGIASGGKADIEFVKNGNAPPFEASGWSSPEAIGTWTNGPEASLRVSGLSPDRGELTIRAIALGFYAKSHTEVNVTVSVNGHEVTVWALRMTDKSSERVAEAPSAFLGPPVTTISFAIDDARSPLELGVSADPRKLGMLLVKVSLTQQR